MVHNTKDVTSLATLVFCCDESDVSALVSKWANRKGVILDRETAQFYLQVAKDAVKAKR